MRVKIFAHVNSKKPRIEKDLLGDLHVYVNQPALEGKANGAITLALAKHFDVSRSSVTLIQGKKSKLKIFEIKLL